MADTPIYDYNLTLQNDPDERAKFVAAKAAVKTMIAHGITDPALHAALLSSNAKDHETVKAAVRIELSAGAPAAFAENVIMYGTDDDAQGDR